MISGHLPTDFSLFLFLVHAGERPVLRRRRCFVFAAAAARARAARVARGVRPAQRPGPAGGPEAGRAERAALLERAGARPWWLEYTAGFFPVILLVFLLRSFLFEPFRIPSGSMIPTLEVGDLILVNKYEYGIRLPILNRTVVQIGQPKRGDVIVFPLSARHDPGLHQAGRRTAGRPHRVPQSRASKSMARPLLWRPWTGITSRAGADLPAVWEKLGETQHRSHLGRRRRRPGLCCSAANKSERLRLQ
jgi:hypothetical protein